MPYIFISYAREDRAITERLFNLLSRAYDHVWYDNRLRAGQEWERELLRRIGECTEFFFLLSKHSITSEWCKREFNEAARLSRHILVYRVDETDIPSWLQHLQVAELREINADTVVEVFATLIRHYSGN